MMGKTTNKFSPEVRERATRMVLDHRQDYSSHRAALVSIFQKIHCSQPALSELVKCYKSATYKQQTICIFQSNTYDIMKEAKKYAPEDQAGKLKP